MKKFYEFAFIRAKKGDTECIEFVLDHLAWKVENEEDLDILESEFLVTYLRGGNRPGRGRPPKNVDEGFKIAFAIKELVDSGMKPHKAIEVYVKKIQSPNDDTDIGRQFLTIYNEYKGLLEHANYTVK